MTNDFIKAADALADAVEKCGGDDNSWTFWDELTAYREARSAQDGELTRLREQVETLRGTLEWYKQRVENCNRHGIDGDATRHALAHDLGERAHRALEATK